MKEDVVKQVSSLHVTCESLIHLPLLRIYMIEELNYVFSIILLDFFLGTREKMFEQNSFIRYALTFNPGQFSNEIQLSFRTRQKHGELFRAMSKQGREYLVLEVRMVFSFYD